MFLTFLIELKFSLSLSLSLAFFNIYEKTFVFGLDLSHLLLADVLFSGCFIVFCNALIKFIPP